MQSCCVKHLYPMWLLYVTVYVCVCESFLSTKESRCKLWCTASANRKYEEATVALSVIYQHMNQNNRWIVAWAIWESARVLCNQWTLIIPVKVGRSLRASRSVWRLLIFWCFYPATSVCLVPSARLSESHSIRFGFLLTSRFSSPDVFVKQSQSDVSSLFWTQAPHLPFEPQHVFFLSFELSTTSANAG